MMLLNLLTKMIACSGILFGYYWLFLRNKRFHHYNRFYLLAATCVSIVFPFIRIPVSTGSDTTTAQLVTKSIAIISVNRWEDEIDQSSDPGLFASLFTLPNILLAVYVAVTLVLIYMLSRSLLYIHRLSTRYPYEQINSFKLYNTTEPGTPFSFFRSIFWNRRLDVNSSEGQQIFRHELFHVKQQHSADIIFLELVSIFCWINPFFHLVKKEMKAIHEFLADQHAVGENNEHAYAELLILHSLSLKKSTISHYFFQNHIKRRIAMITQFKSKKYSYWSRLLVLPLGIFLFCAIALYAQTGGASTKTPSHLYSGYNQVTKPVKVLVDAGHGGTDAGVQGNGIQEKDLSLAIAKQIKQHASLYNIEVVMTRDDDNNASLRERTNLAADAKADLVVSIHIGAAEAGTTQSGFDIYITNRNQETLVRSKLLGQNIADQIRQIYTVAPIKQRADQGIWILDAAPAPAVLIECGYMTSPQDIAFITNTKNQEQLAKKILEGISIYQNDKSIHSTDTIPGKKKTTDAVNIQRKEIDAEKVRRIAEDKKIQSQRRQAEIASRKMTESRIEIQKQNEEIEIRKRDVTQKKNTISREKMTNLERKDQVLAKKNREIQARQLKQMKMQDNAYMAKQKALESRQRLLENKIRNQSDDLKKKLEQLEQQEKVLEQQRAEEMEIRQQLLLEKQKTLELEQKEMTEIEMSDIENKQRIIQEKHSEKEIKPRIMRDSKFEIPEKPVKKSSGDKPRKPITPVKANE